MQQLRARKSVSKYNKTVKNIKCTISYLLCYNKQCLYQIHYPVSNTAHATTISRTHSNSELEFYNEATTTK